MSDLIESEIVDRIRTKPYVLALDLDATVHSYELGWHDGTLYGTPLPGAKEAIQRILNAGWEILLYTARVKHEGEFGYKPMSAETIKEWWDKYELPPIKIWSGHGKPLAHVYLDDRAIRFQSWETAVEDVLSYPDVPHYFRIRKPSPEDIDFATEKFKEQLPDFAEEGVRSLLKLRCLDPNSNGLKDTPARVVKAFLEMTSGYEDDPKEILSRQFEGIEYDEFVILRKASFVSLCEHHMLPFIGTAAIGYLPGKNIVGLSKLERLLHCFAKRLQVQERLTTQIADALIEHLECPGAGVVIRASHGCMSCRGVRDPGAEMVTSALRGVFKEPSQRYEFLHLVS